jgi:(1->4)-alpha-D-glucan 1-alpha-D-glucosylmutase
LLKVASPGVADFYQGSELWDFSLVDPDNRRPVDYEVRRKWLDRAASPAELVKNLADGRAKLHVIRKGLELRKAQPGLFHGGDYQPLYADAGREENVIAFSLGSRAVAVAPRLFARLMQPDALAPLGERVWGEARLALPEAAFEDILTGRKQRGGEARVAEILAEFPVALLVAR